MEFSEDQQKLFMVVRNQVRVLEWGEVIPNPIKEPKVIYERKIEVYSRFLRYHIRDIF
jgi:hypothetical protein